MEVNTTLEVNTIPYEYQDKSFYVSLTKDGAQQFIVDVLKNRDLPDEDKIIKITKCCEISKANLNDKSTYQKGSTLKIALYAQNSEKVFKFLLDKGADLKTDDQASPLHHAAFIGREDLISLFVDKGLDVNTVDYKGEVALHYAIRMTQVKAVQRLLELKAKKDVLDNTGKALNHVARNNPAILELLNNQNEQEVSQETLSTDNEQSEISSIKLTRKSRFYLKSRSDEGAKRDSDSSITKTTEPMEIPQTKSIKDTKSSSFGSFEKIKSLLKKITKEEEKK